MMIALAAIVVVAVVLAASVVYGEVAVIAGWDLRQLSLHLASVVRQNLPLAQGLRAFSAAEAVSPAIARRTALDRVASLIEEGMPLADAMDTEPGCFPPHYRALVRAGERGGNLAGVFARLAETSHVDRSDASRVQDAVYLASQLIIMCGVLAVIRIVVVPQFLMMWSEIRAEFPPYATLLTVAGLAVPVALALGIVALFGLPVPGLGGRLRMWVPELARMSACIRWRMPVFSRYERRRAASRYCLAAGELLAAGNLVFDRIATDAADRVMEGAKISDALAEADSRGEFPRELAWYVKLGEASGRLPDALARASEAAEARSRTVLAKLVNLMLPACTIVLGVFVGMICIAAMGPLIQSAACAFAVIAVATGMVVSLLASSRDAARRTVETRLAASVAQGAYERLRSGAHSAPPPEGAVIELPLPPEAERLDGARLTATSRPWRDIKGAHHIEVTFEWRPRRSGGRAGAKTRRIVREGLVSDARAR
ncbi:MAG: type II secretion system F family protein [Planctomycetota bacterium]|jgi:type II secretory pathway component PulF